MSNFFSRFIGISDALPKSSGVRFVDVWMLFSLFLPFVEVLIQTYIHHLQNAVDNEKQNAKEKQHAECWKEPVPSSKRIKTKHVR